MSSIVRVGFALALLALLFDADLGHDSSAQQPTARLDLKVMTFNLKYASEQGENKWSDRRGVLRNAIVRNGPDLIGTQEGLYHQLKNIDEDLADYDWIGEGRLGGSAGELMAIYYLRDRLEPLRYGHFWLSETPEVIASKSWDSSLPRMVTWVLFRERETRAEFYLFNTHFDHRGQIAREKSAELLIARIRAQRPARPVLVTGDFNQPQASTVHGTLVGGEDGELTLADAWEQAERHDGEQVSTIHGWRGVHEGARRIDWVLHSSEFTARSAEVVTHEENGQYPSDHFPVVATLTLSVGEEAQ